MANKLQGAARDAALEGLARAGWALQDGRDAIAKTFVFRDFTQAFGWMTQVAIQAEKLNHHPEWSNVWSRVEIAITNHDAGGLTELDLEFCRRVDRLRLRAAG